MLHVYKSHLLVEEKVLITRVLSPLDIGNDPMRPQATNGIHLHHLCIRIKDPKVSLPFYKEILGMRTLFTLNAGPFSVYCE